MPKIRYHHQPRASVAQDDLDLPASRLWRSCKSTPYIAVISGDARRAGLPHVWIFVSSDRSAPAAKFTSVAAAVRWLEQRKEVTA
jgi:hypothetical protein